ncbi:MAG: iron-containing alcohol dehydrogenase [Verrucomicrobiae bacterium]|nr:iron-containing alcohol dehydrogenase [Verrucomicrobiae bacterium]MDW7981054.1 iron-containing alcohol dehydrogenase [Verrucomicrobiales bacterium]
MQFEFATASQIVFGEGALEQLPGLARGLGTRALLVTGRDSARAAKVLELLEKTDRIVSVATCSVTGEPTVEWVERQVEAARNDGCDLVIGFGGGSAIDAAKAVAGMLTNHGRLLDYLEVIGGGKPLVNPSVPFIAIPTTAGTGAEVTRNAVLLSTAHKVKVSLRSRLLLPRLALVDPKLTYGLPPELTAATGMDALTQLIEAYVSCRANPMTDSLCAEGIRRAARALRTAFEDGQNASARRDMALAAMFSGIALANAGLGAVHGFAGVIGGMFGAPHGAVCAALLPHVMSTNIRALRARAPGAETLRKYAEVAQLLTGRRDAAPEEGAAWIAELLTALRIPRLRAYGMSESHLAQVVEQAARASSMRGNPIALTPEEMADAVRAAM